MEKIELNTPEDEITLFTDEENVVPDKMDFEFAQSSKLRGIYRKITLFNGNHCYQSIKNKHKRKYKYRVDIAFLNPRPFRERKIAWKWLYSSIALLFISMVMITVRWYTDWVALDHKQLYMTALIVALSSSFIALLLFAHNTYDKIVFRTQFGNIKLIELLNKCPSEEAFREFMGRFIAQIKTARKQKGFTASKFLAKELRELRRLRDEQVITEEEYQAAKVVIFKHDSFKATRD